jgi:hypothetical protein
MSFSSHVVQAAFESFFGYVQHIKKLNSNSDRLDFVGFQGERVLDHSC